MSGSDFIQVGGLLLALFYTPVVAGAVLSSKRECSSLQVALWAVGVTAVAHPFVLG